MDVYGAEIVYNSNFNVFVSNRSRGLSNHAFHENLNCKHFFLSFNKFTSFCMAVL